jgi:hypothetical protein
MWKTGMLGVHSQCHAHPYLVPTGQTHFIMKNNSLYGMSTLGNCGGGGGGVRRRLI